jgi:hypothetical protein
MARSIQRLLLVVLGLQIVVNGCANPESLQVRGPDQAVVGELVTFYYSINPNCGKVFGGPSDPTGALCPPSDSISKLVDATCDAGACVLDTAQPSSISNGGLVLNLVGSTAGPTVLRVRVELTNGSQMTATSPLSFVIATGLHPTCALAVAGDGFMPPFGQCGGLYPVFTGSSWKWTVVFDTDSGPLGVADPSFSVQGNAVTFDSASGSFQSGSTDGTAQVVISSRQFTKTVPVRVVSMSDIVSGELRLVTRADGIEQQIAQIGPAPSTLWYPPQNGLAFDGDDPGVVAIQPLLTLSDGTQVYGGAGFLASDHPAVCTVGPLSAAANLVQQTTVRTECRSDGTATFAATVGVATITWPVTVAPPPSP